MAMASPSLPPFSSHDSSFHPPHIPKIPPAHPTRPGLKRASPLSVVATLPTGPSNASQMFLVDSSDDDLPAPMKFSALTKALLNDDASAIEASSPSTASHGAHNLTPSFQYRPRVPRRTFNDGSHPLATTQRDSPKPRRVVRLSVGSPTSGKLRRTVSTALLPSPTPDEAEPTTTSPHALITPVPKPRSRLHSTSVSESGGSSARSLQNLGTTHSEALPDGGDADRVSSSQRRAQVAGRGGVPRYASSAGSRSRQGEENLAQSSLRIKRVGKVTGSYLSGPARRGRRRQSEEDYNSPPEEACSAPELPNSIDRPPSPVDRGEPGGVRELSENHDLAQASRPSIEGKPTEQQRDIGARRSLHGDDGGLLGSAISPLDSLLPREDSIGAPDEVREAVDRPVFKAPALPPPLPSTHDQENEPPPTFKKNKPPTYSLLDKLDHAPPTSNVKMLGTTPASDASKRRVLAPRSQNTPHRPAPAPPKMSVLETATVSAGAATTSHSRKKRSQLTINGKIFTRLDCIGRGGSSRVYRVFAENYNIFALKKVALQDVDEVAVRGYKGEIDLLKKLENVDRVVDLLDWEINDEKQSLSMLMEIGECDLSRMLDLRLNAENAKFDINFARYHWKEMLECVRAIHDVGIVHSDLKPANFLLVKGRLKLIDFGIANAIQEDTVNVHREHQVGTPNYMAPESFMISGTSGALPASVGKVMKLGRPSDVWSLGCMLYQMVYGKPPFAHLSSAYQKVMAIPNPNHIIDFPRTGLGGVEVPDCLGRTLQGCLTRDQHQRPTIAQLLDVVDPFLHPDAEPEGIIYVSHELLGRIIAKVVGHCKYVGIPNDTELAAWPARFFTRIKKGTQEQA
ncbi:MAG: Dual-specificity kinase, spindle pole body (SPB) duplication and spindle checkpoint function [Piccolia ochrophora]|nr:MAG: Dual-specificity kinase, spindle pole body (SPB) duplication and spindle checkpoint function [Piccolia ochrophora]